MLVTLLYLFIEARTHKHNAHWTHCATYFHHKVSFSRETYVSLIVQNFNSFRVLLLSDGLPRHNVQDDNADGGNDVIFVACHHHGQEVVRDLACFHWCGQWVVHAFLNVAKHTRKSVSQ